MFGSRNQALGVGDPFASTGSEGIALATGCLLPGPLRNIDLQLGNDQAKTKKKELGSTGEAFSFGFWKGINLCS